MQRAGYLTCPGNGTTLAWTNVVTAALSASSIAWAVALLPYSYKMSRMITADKFPTSFPLFSSDFHTPIFPHAQRKAWHLSRGFYPAWPRPRSGTPAVAASPSSRRSKVDVGAL